MHDVYLLVFTASLYFFFEICAKFFCVHACMQEKLTGRVICQKLINNAPYMLTLFALETESKPYITSLKSTDASF